MTIQNKIYFLPHILSNNCNACMHFNNKCDIFQVSQATSISIKYIKNIIVQL